jgi:hypothetical protein
MSVAGPHADAHHGAHAGSGHPRDVPTRVGRSARTHRHNKCSRDRSGCKSALAPRSAGSCRADTSAPAATAMPLPQHWTAPGKSRHKGPAQLPLPGTAHPGTQGSDVNLELLGPRLSKTSPTSIAQTLRRTRSAQTYEDLLPPTGGRPRLFRETKKEIGNRSGHRRGHQSPGIER